jgi:acetolactate synthase-1/2/3 large subunit
MTNAEAIAETLAEAGIDIAFGHPGGEVVLLIDACRRAGIRFMLTGHEASAAFMADVTGQITGRPGVCISTLGPGALNLTTGVANAYLDRSPVLALTAEISTELQPHFPHQRIPLTRIFSLICKLSVVADGNGTAELTHQCLSLAAEPRPGPVHIALPSNLAARPSNPRRPEIEGPPSHQRSSGGLHEIAAALNRAISPLIVLGVGCPPGARSSLQRFVQQTQIPYVTTPKGKGLLSEDSDHFLGVAGGMALDNLVLETIEHADLLVGIGFDPVECDKDWYVSRTVVNLSEAVTGEGRYRPLEYIGAIDHALDELTGAVEAKPWPADLLAARRRRVRPQTLHPKHGVSPLMAIRTLRELLPREAVLTCDVGSHKYFAGQFWETYLPHTFFMSNGLSSMGYGIPAAIAAKLQFPTRPVVALVGDGGFLMTLHNLVFLTQYRVPILIICFVDHSLSLIRLGQSRRGISPYGVDFPAPDFRRVAESFGIKSTHATSIEQVASAIETFLHSDEPYVVHVDIDTNEYELYA